MAETKLLPQIPVLTEYLQVKNELQARIDKLNAIEYLTDENQKEVKTSIAEINKVKDRIARYRIDSQNEFLKHIEPYIAQCKELEKMCTDGVATIKSKVAELEEKERQQKIETVEKLFEFHIKSSPYRKLFKFEMFFEKSMGNKTSNLNVIENQMKKWIEDKTNDLKFIEYNTDEPSAIMPLYIENGLVLTKAIETYQERFKNESEIKAMIAAEESKTKAEPIEKTLDIVLSIYKLPKSKVAALQGFLDNLGVIYNAEVMRNES